MSGPRTARTICVFLLLASSVLVWGTGLIEEGPVPLEDAVPGDLVVVTGVLGIYGSEPHTYFGVLREDETPPLIRVDAPAGSALDERMVELVGLRVEADGELVSRARGPGFPPVVACTAIRRASDE